MEGVMPTQRSMSEPARTPPPSSPPPQPSENDEPLRALRERIGRSHLQRRLGLEADHEVFVFKRSGAHFFYPENWYSIHGFIRHSLRLVGLYGRAQRNARAIRIRRNLLPIRRLPSAFAGYRILHLSDLHVDMDPGNTQALVERVREVDYDLCVLTGDYRALTFGPYGAVLEGMARVRLQLKDPIYAILGNHDTIRMVPELENLGIHTLLNETVTLKRNGRSLHLAGIDDAHYYQVHNIDKAAALIPDGAPSLLLSHTPEPYRHAAHAGFAAMLCGHTHGGQICLPGGFPLTWDARCPRHMAAGPWRHGRMLGYTSVGAGTSVVNARLNCPPEITLHELQVG
jgi:predicted MPP superfamily phosphohydrolase